MKTCNYDGCANPQRARGYCTTHLQRLYRYGTVELVNRPQPSTCIFDGCNGKPRGKGRCHRHWMMGWRMNREPGFVQLTLFPTEPLARCIRASRVNYSELSRRTGIPRRTIERVMNEQRWVRFYTVDVIACSLGLHPTAIFGDDWTREAA